MLILKVNAWGWRSPLDFYDAVLTALEAPAWHGRNVNALIDSVIYGGVNGAEPPFRIEVIGLEGSAADVREELQVAFDALRSEGAKVTIGSREASLEMS